MFICIVGSRSFNKAAEAFKYLDTMVSEGDVFVCGKADGADAIGEGYANKRKHVILEFPPKWDDLTEKPCKIGTRKDGTKYNMMAGYNRNRRMVEFLAGKDSLVVAFWDGTSPGTKHMITLARENGIRVIVK